MPEAPDFAILPEEALDFFRAKLRIPTTTWTAIWQGAHARAFVIAGATSDALLADFQESLDRALAEGRTLADFRKDFDRIVAAHGWSYRGTPGWRSAVIYNTNLRTAYAAGQWQRIQRVKKQRPWLRYVAVRDQRTRPLHREWNDTILPVDHVFWETHFPPNGWNCRCSIQQLAERDLKRRGLKVSAQPPPVIPVTRTVNTPAGPVAVKTSKGIDPGFNYNVGIAGFGRGADAVALAADAPRWLPLIAPGGATITRPDLSVVAARAAPLAKEPLGEAALRQAFRAALGGDEAILSDPAGGRIAISQALVDHFLEDISRQGGQARYLPLIAELIEDPAEIWIGFETDAKTGKVAMRRRYVKLVRIDKKRIIGLVAEAGGRRFTGLTFFAGKLRQAQNLRTGLLIYRKAGTGQ